MCKLVKDSSEERNEKLIQALEHKCGIGLHNLHPLDGTHLVAVRGLIL